MMNTIYLVLLIGTFQTATYTGAVSLPQANMKQCQVNAKNLLKDHSVKKAYCIVGIK